MKIFSSDPPPPRFLSFHIVLESQQEINALCQVLKHLRNTHSSWATPTDHELFITLVAALRARGEDI